MRKGCRCPTNPFLPRGPEWGQQWKPKGSAAARTCGEGGEEPGVALSKGGVADPAEIEHHGRPHHEHHVPTGPKKMSEEVSCWLVSHPPSRGRHHPGHSAELTMLSWRGTPGNPSGRGGWAGPRAGAPTHRTSPQVAHLPQQGLLPVHQVLGEHTVAVVLGSPQTIPVPATKLSCCRILGCKPLPCPESSCSGPKVP